MFFHTWWYGIHPRHRDRHLNGVTPCETSLFHLVSSSPEGPFTPPRGTPHQVPGSCEAGLYGTQIYPEALPSRHPEGSRVVRYTVVGWYLEKGLQPGPEGGYLELGGKYEMLFGPAGPRLARVPRSFSLVAR